MSLLKKVKQTGWCYAAAIVFNRVVPGWLFRCRRFAIYQLDPNSFDDTASADGLEVSWCDSEAELEAAAKFSCFDRGSLCGENSACQAILDNKLVGAFWATGNFFSEHDLGVEIILAPEQKWLFSAYVDRESRNRGIYSSVLRYVVEDLQQNGTSSPLVAVNPDNLGSDYIHRKHAISSPGTVLGIRFLKFAVCFASGYCQHDRWLTLNCVKNPIKVQIQTGT